MALDTQNKAPFQTGAELNEGEQETQPRRFGRRLLIVGGAAGGVALLTGGIAVFVNRNTAGPSIVGDEQEDWTFGQGGQGARQEGAGVAANPLESCMDIVGNPQVQATIGLMVPGVAVSPECRADPSGEPLASANIKNDGGDELDIFVTTQKMDWSNPAEYDPLMIGVGKGKHVTAFVSKMLNHPWVGIQTPEYSVVVDYNPQAAFTKQHVEQAVGLARTIATNQFG